MKLLARYGEIQREILALQTEAQKIKEGLERHVADHGEVIAYGWKAGYSYGNASIDNEQAVKDAVAEGQDLSELIKKHTSQPKPKTSWAKVVKGAKIDTAGYKTEGKKSFAVKVVS